MELRNFAEWRHSREKLRGLEQVYLEAERSPVENPLTRELSLRSLQRLIDQIRGEVDQFEARMSRVVLDPGSIKFERMPEAAPTDRDPAVDVSSTPAWAIVELWNQGVPAESIPHRLPGVDLMDVFEALHDFLKYRQDLGSWEVSKAASEGETRLQTDRPAC